MHRQYPLLLGIGGKAIYLQKKKKTDIFRCLQNHKYLLRMLNLKFLCSIKTPLPQNNIEIYS